MEIRELLYLLQTGYGRTFYRFVWNAVVGPFVFYYFTGTWTALLWGAHMRGRGFWFALGHLPPSLVTLLAVLWVAVFLRLRPGREHPDTMIALVRFWTEFRKYRQISNDISHEGFAWAVSVPTELSAGMPADGYPGIRVTIPPRCPKCNLNLSESRFKGGWYWTCGHCTTRRISRQAFAQAAGDIENLAFAAWKLTSEQGARPSNPHDVPS
jgi:hypothetical protein